ncbi:MAG: DNA topoisomerase I [Candidatus Aenigmarchaeota archaeon]|nr:DNA topoisomerase I [Candidatus Aenigmarchaeota archaeon]
MGYIFILTEKPDAMRRIAEALAEKNLTKKIDENGVTYYEFERNGKKHLVACAVGHLFTLEPMGSGWSYPTFEMGWKPSFQVRKESSFSEKYFQLLKKLKGPFELVVAMDYDIEGDVIARNVLKFIYGVEDAKRMKFSTLTKEELQEAYENMLPHMNFGQVEAGLTRHYLDALWGFNTTRALTLALKSQAQRGFAILSSGRVQSPTLAMLLERELEIRKFKPTPFWELQLHVKIDGIETVANYEGGKIWKKEEADKILQACEGKDATVKNIKKRRYKQSPPIPFNTTDLQAESYTQFKFSPTQAMAIAESLYQAGYISYPRSSSQKLPPSINYQKILQALSTLPTYKNFAEELLKKEKLTPREGPRTDPAHPAVYATWEVPDLKKLTPQQKKIYDLVVRRTLSTFADEATRESMNVSLDVNGYKFIVVGKRTIKPGWTKIYKPYLAVEELILPELKVGQTIKVLKLEELAKETQPPGRYSQGSILKELEKRNLGTKCLTEDNLIPILNENHFCEVTIKNLLEHENSFERVGEKISINSNKYCFCVFDNNLTISKFNLVSRRKVEPNEKIYEVVFEDGSKIKATESHPILIYNNGFEYIPINKITSSTKVVSTFIYPSKFYGEIGFKEFVRKLNSKSKLYTYADLKAWRKTKNLTQKEVGKILDIRQGTIAGWERKKVLPLWIWKKLDLTIPNSIFSTNKNTILKNPFPLKISSPLIRLTSHLLGDGSLDREKLMRENCFDFRYTNKNIELIEQFVGDIESVFGRKIGIKNDKRDPNKYYLQLPAIIGRIIGTLFGNIVQKNLNVPLIFYPDFIGSLFDDEGYACKNEPKIFISNTNFTLIKTLEKYLKKLGFSPYIREQKHRRRGWKRAFKIFLYGKDLPKFLELIPFFHKKKKERIIGVLTRSYGYRGIPIPAKLLEKKVYSSLTKEGLTMKEISEVCNLPINSCKTAIKNLIKGGYVKKKIIGISEYPRKKILYFPTKECSKTFYTYLDETVLSPTLITKTVRTIREVEYDGYVYDITNPLTSNFVLSNGIVVHNSTRAEILQTLYDRGYIQGKAIQVNKLGEAVVEALKENCSRILSEKLTRHFEQEMELVFNSKKKKEEVIEEAKKSLEIILKEFKNKEKNIGKKLLEGLIAARREERKIGICPNCGGELRIIRSKRSGLFFIGCSNYPKCKNAYPIPRMAKIQAIGKVCEKCNTPIIQVQRKGKRPFRMCLDTNCITKKDWNKKKI